MLLLWPTLTGAQAREVEVNTASRAALESVPGIGPALAERLLARRPFADWPDLVARAGGVRSATAQRLSDSGLRVNSQPFSH